MGRFLRFFLETNQIFKWIDNEADLDYAFNLLLDARYTLSSIRRCSHERDRIEFGRRIEHQGDQTLFNFLEYHNINIDKWK